MYTEYNFRKIYKDDAKYYDTNFYYFDKDGNDNYIEVFFIKKSIVVNLYKDGLIEVFKLSKKGKYQFEIEASQINNYLINKGYKSINY